MIKKYYENLGIEIDLRGETTSSEMKLISNATLLDSGYARQRVIHNYKEVLKNDKSCTCLDYFEDVVVGTRKYGESIPIIDENTLRKSVIKEVIKENPTFVEYLNKYLDKKLDNLAKTDFENKTDTSLNVFKKNSIRKQSEYSHL